MFGEAKTSSSLTTEPRWAATAPVPLLLMEAFTVALCSIMKSMKAFMGFFLGTCFFRERLAFFLTLQDTETKREARGNLIRKTPEECRRVCVCVLLGCFRCYLRLCGKTLLLQLIRDNHLCSNVKLKVKRQKQHH